MLLFRLINTVCLAPDGCSVLFSNVLLTILMGRGDRQTARQSGESGY